MDRRNFLMSSAAALGAAQSTFGQASNKVRVAVVGIGGRGRNHIDSFNRLENVEIVGVCDVDQGNLAKAAAQVEMGGKKPKPQMYKDIRKMLEVKDIDAISVATPNHWHTLMTIWGVQAGKDVYCEKPCSHNMFEAKQIVAATRKYNRIVQHGSQIRSSKAVQEGMKHIRDGTFGDIYLGRGICFKWRDTIGKQPYSAPPGTVDYDLWTGPAPMKDFKSNRFHYNWHWYWDYGNGDLGNQGIHEVDVARWGLGVTYPTKVSAIGGKFLFEDDDQETPNTIACLYEFVGADGKKKMMEFEVRHWMTHGESTIRERGNNAIGNTFYGSKGYATFDSYTSYKSWLGEKQGRGGWVEKEGPQGREGGDHFLNFIEAVRSRDRKHLNAEIEEGAISTTLVHLANISYRVGRTLNFDAASYSVKGDSEANKMFTREYRKPYVVPEKV
jgi:predicted dehydrogenase